MPPNNQPVHCPICSNKETTSPKQMNMAKQLVGTCNHWLIMAYQHMLHLDLRGMLVMSEGVPDQTMIICKFGWPWKLEKNTKTSKRGYSSAVDITPRYLYQLTQNPQGSPRPARGGRCDFHHGIAMRRVGYCTAELRNKVEKELRSKRERVQFGSFMGYYNRFNHRKFTTITLNTGPLYS